MLPRPLLVLLACVLVVGGMVLAGRRRPPACTCQPADAERQAAADAVFIGAVNAGQPEVGEQLRDDVDGHPGLQGHASTQPSVTHGPPDHRCGLGELVLGTDYLFFVRGAPRRTSPTAAAAPARSTPTWWRRSRGPRRGHGRAAAPARRRPTFTRSRTSPPASLARLAAPGGALVLVGLLGLVVVGARADAAGADRC